MAVDASKNDLLIGVVGAGAMGRGIVQVAAAGGIQVKVFDIDKDQLKDAVEFIDTMLGRAVEKGRIQFYDPETDKEWEKTNAGWQEVK